MNNLTSFGKKICKPRGKQFVDIYIEDYLAGKINLTEAAAYLSVCFSKRPKNETN